MLYDFDQVWSREKNESIKWNRLESLYGTKDVLPMWVADMEFKAPQVIIDALQERLNQGIFGYTDLDDAFFDAFINWVKSRHGWQLKQEDLMFSPGVVPSIVMSILSFTKPDDKVIIQPPVYGPFDFSVSHHKRQVVKNPLIEKDGRYDMDLEHLESLFKAGHKVLILCNPHNPVGRVWDQKTLEGLAKLVHQYDAMVISDEIHSDLILPGHQHIPFASLENMADKTITFMAPTKTFNLAGLQTSIVVCENKAWHEALKSTFEKMDLKINNYFGQTAFKAAYNHGQEWLDALLEYLDSNMDYAVEFFKKHLYELKIVKPQGTYLLWIDFRNLHMSQEQLKDFLVKKAKLALTDGGFFGQEGQGFMRMNLACPRSMLEEGLNRLEKAMRTLRL